jgi:hypothetical protein
VAAADDAVQEISGARVAGQIPELVQRKYVGHGVALHASLDGGDRLLLQEVCKGGVDAREADGTSRFERALSEVLGERALADAARSAEKDTPGRCRR